MQDHALPRCNRSGDRSTYLPVDDGIGTQSPVFFPQRNGDAGRIFGKPYNALPLEDRLTARRARTEVAADRCIRCPSAGFVRSNDDARKRTTKHRLSDIKGVKLRIGSRGRENDLGSGSAQLQ